MKKILLSSILFIIFISNYSEILFAEEIKDTPFSISTDYKLYKERVKNICLYYKEKKQIAFLIDNNKELTEKNSSITKIKRSHRENMNSIYKCAILSTQKKSLFLIKNDLIKKNPNLNKKISEKIKKKIDKIDLSTQKFGCENSVEKSSIQKERVLKQATYETCKYIAYLEYLKDYSRIIKNITPVRDEAYTIKNIVDIQKEHLLKIDEEIKHTYKVFPMAFHAYTEYENNITIHFLLELIKEDYIILRQKLHKVLNPINQVVYKISNAMRK